MAALQSKTELSGKMPQFGITGPHIMARLVL